MRVSRLLRMFGLATAVVLGLAGVSGPPAQAGAGTFHLDPGQKLNVGRCLTSTGLNNYVATLCLDSYANGVVTGECRRPIQTVTRNHQGPNCILAHEQ